MFCKSATEPLNVSSRLHERPTPEPFSFPIQNVGQIRPKPTADRIADCRDCRNETNSTHWRTYRKDRKRQAGWLRQQQQQQQDADAGVRRRSKRASVSGEKQESAQSTARVSGPRPAARALVFTGKNRGLLLPPPPPISASLAASRLSRPRQGKSANLPRSLATIIPCCFLPLPLPLPPFFPFTRSPSGHASIHPHL